MLTAYLVFVDQCWAGGPADSSLPEKNSEDEQCSPVKYITIKR